jgi:hypothetical protein
MNYLLTNESVVMFLNGKPTKVSKESAAYAKIIKALSLPPSEQEAEILEILAEANPNRDIESGGFVIRGEEVFYKGDALPKPLAQKILSLIKENLPVAIFEKFWENLQKNPSRNSVNELYDFLAYKELPITDDGCFIAYRGLESNWYSVKGNLQTKVLKGKVNSSGQIYNGVGEEIEIERNSCDDNRENGCSVGVHAGSFNYACSWSNGKTVAVKINPKDVVSVPKDYDCQKLRCCAYTVISEVKDELTVAATDEKGNVVVNEVYKQANLDRQNLIARIQTYLANKKKLGHSYISVKAVQSIFSPQCPSTVEVCDAIVSAGYVWKQDGQGKYVIL